MTPEHLGAGRAVRIVAAASACAVVAGLAACTPTPTLLEGSRAVVAIDEPVTSLNAATSYGRTTSNADVASLTGIVAGWWDDEYVLHAEGEATAEIVDEDPFTVRYAVPDGLTWSDGAPVDAADLLLAWVASSGARNDQEFDDADVVDPETGRYTDDFPDDVVWFDGEIGGGLERTRALPQLGSDGRSIEVELDAPVHDWRLLLPPGPAAHVVAAVGADAPIGTEDEVAAAKRLVTEAVLGDDQEVLAPISRAWNDAFNLDATPEDERLLVAAGPYRVTALEDGSATLEANPAYRGPRTPTLERIELRHVPDPLEAVGLLRAGEVDVVSPTPTEDVVEALMAVEGAQVRVTRDAVLEQLTLRVSEPRSAALEDPLVRRALLLTVPREQIVDELVRPIDPEAAPAEVSLLREGSTAAVDALEEGGLEPVGDADVRAAERLLDEAGVRDVPVCILYDSANPRRAAEYELIAASAVRAGFVVSSCASPDWRNLLDVPGAYDAALFGWDSTRVGPAAAAESLRGGGARANFTGVEDDRVGDILAELDGAVDDDAARDDALVELEARVRELDVGVPLFSHPAVTATSDRVVGVTRSPLARGVLWNAWRWRPADAADGAAPAASAVRAPSR